MVAGKPQVHYGKGIHALRRGDYLLAVSHFDNAVQLRPRTAVYWYYRALANRRAGQHKRARHDALIGAQLEHAIDRNRNLINAITVELTIIQGIDRFWLEEFRTGDPTWKPSSKPK
jgi:tetratricopeptide (TPR) repeat protein